MRNFYEKHYERLLFSITFRAITLIALMLFCTPSLMAQNGKFTLKVNNSTLENVLKLIENQGPYKLLYNYEEVSKVNGITFDLKNVSVEEILTKSLTNTNLKFTINNNTIIIGKASASTTRSAVNPVRITGRVVDKDGKPIVGASVMFIGTTRGVVTNTKGEFTLTSLGNNHEILFSFMGYKPEKVVLASGQTEVNVTLHEDALNIENIYIETGYQTLSKREMASAVTQLDAEELNLGAQTSIDQMLAGKVAGMMVLPTSGEPSATPTIRIRGTSSIVGSRAPLWVLDGIILEDPVNVDVTNINSPDAAYLIGNAIAGINARDIESITVLKDASATAIYGVRASNGVIVVTTKKGVMGAPQIRYSGNFTYNQRTDYGSLNLMNAGERVKLSQEIMADNIKYPRVPAGYGYEGLLMDYYNHKISYDQFSRSVTKMVDNNTDWYDILFRNTLSHNHNLSISGGGGKTTYYGSFSYGSTPGTAKGSDSELYTGMVKLNSWFTDNIYLGIQLNSSRSNNKGFHPSVNPNAYAYETARTLPCYNDDGSLFYYSTFQKSQTAPNIAPKQDLQYNIVNELALTQSEATTNATTAQINFQWNFLENFKYKLLGGVDISQTNSTQWAKEASNYAGMIRRWNPGVLEIGTKEWDESPLPVGGIYTNNDQKKNSYTLRNSIEFSKLFEGDHLLSISGTNEIRSIDYNGISQTQYGWQPERGMTIAPFLTTGYVGVLSSLRSRLTDYVNNTVSWLGIATYSYADKLTFNANARVEGSNNFGTNPKYRFKPVWSVAGKYTLTNEKFMKNVPVLSYLAVRASLGVQGNIDKSSTPDLIIQVGSKNDKSGLYESYIKYLPNPDLRWEETTSSNIGLDFALGGVNAKRKLDIISGTIDFYEKMGRQMIVTKAVSQVIGLTQVKINGGRVKNTGIDASLQIVPFQTRDFDVSLQLIASYNKNTLLEANKEIGVNNADKLSGTALIEGQPLEGFYSYPSAGINSESGYPMVYNKNNEKRYELYNSETELVYSGVRTPPLSGGVNIRLRYKSWYLSAGFNYSEGGVDRLPAVYGSNIYSVFDPFQNVTKKFNDRWRKPGDITDVPALYDSERYKAVNLKYIADNNIPQPGSTEGSSTPMLSMYDRSSARVASTTNVRMRDLSLNYIFPEKMLKPLGIQSLSVALQAQNLFLWVKNGKWEGRDPETGGSNTPLPKVYTFTINLGF